MMAAAQPFLSGAISKTVNMPKDTTVKDIADAYFWGWQLGLKAIAIYRDGSKQSQPLSTKTEGKKSEGKAADEAIVEKKAVAKPRRERLPDTRNSVTHKFSIAGHEGYINVGLYPDGRPGEVFITMAKEGSTIGGLMDSFGTAISIALQYGVPLEVLVNKFSHTRFEPMGHTNNPDVRFAKSVVDYIFRWLGLTFLASYREEQKAKAELLASSPVESASSAPAKAPSNLSSTMTKTPVNGNGAEVEVQTAVNGTMARFVGVTNQPRVTNITPTPPQEDSRDAQFARFQGDAPACDGCGSVTVRNGNCYLCYNCGNSLGCS
jgi:ribonucleoside-diphosphate reductase alpha chain